MNTPLISIIIPVYKVEKYLDKCIASVVSQSYNNLEILLVDDGSPDKCGEICDNWALIDTRIKVIHKSNGGLSDARNTALDICKGDWISFIDSDDYVSSDYIESLYFLAVSNKCLLGVVSYTEFYEDCQPQITKQSSSVVLFDSIRAVEAMFYQEVFDTTAWGKIYHRSLFDTGIRYPLGILYEDLPTTYLLLLKSNKVAFCNKQLYFYQLRNTSIEGQPFTDKKLDSAIYIVDSVLRNTKDYVYLSDSVKCRLLSFCFHILTEMPSNYNNPRRKYLLNYIKKHRRSVIFNGKARKKARVGALFSFLGISFVRFMLSFVKSRS